MKAALAAIRQLFASPLGQVDLLLALAVAVLNVAAGFSLADSDSGPLEPGPVLWALMIGTGLTIAFRRIWPLTMLAVTALLTMTSWLIGLPNVFMAETVLIYSATVHGRAPYGLRAATGAAAVLTTFTLLGVLVADVPPYVVGLVGLMGISAITLGSGVVNREAYTREVEASAREAAAHRLTREATVLANERNRLARELHDIVAHGLAVISIQAGAAERVLERDSDAARVALGQIQRASREALADMRRVLVALRTDEDPSTSPSPGIDALQEMVADVRATGIDVTLAIDPDVGQLVGRGVLESSIFRLVQEGLTNVIKHAGPHATVSVLVDRAGESVRIEVSDTGRGLAAPATDGGRGLRGMRERVELLGGTFTSGPRVGGGFRMTATLPTEAAAGQSERGTTS